MTSLDRRRSGILLHPTSLPGPHGSGDFGPASYHFIDWLVAAGQSVWQVLPLNPVGPGNSPYVSVSAFAGSPLMIALEPLVQRGWLAPIAPQELAEFDARKVDYGRVVPYRLAKLRAAASGFFAHAAAGERDAFAVFCNAQATWLDDYALFMALDEDCARKYGYRPWSKWESPLARREPAALADARRTHAEEIRFWQFVQWCFASQWADVRAYARGKGVRVVGDLPIYVAHHSADCWARPDLYLLDDAHEPTVVAGVPPDFFSTTGQRWGNPLYDWEAMRRDGYAWWIERVRRQLDLADLVRIDHFRGFAGYWEIPATCPTAIEGRWVPGPGAPLFEAIANALGNAPIIAEDLGVITPDVVALRDRFDFPGMRILQFGFNDDAEHAFLPHNYIPNTVVYSGTHDNDTVNGWWVTATDRERDYASAYLGTDGSDVNWAMIRAASASVARLAVFQMQDVLALDGSHRMNVPGKTGYWTWRFTWDQVGAGPAARLAQIGAAYGRSSIASLHLPHYPADAPKP